MTAKMMCKNMFSGSDVTIIVLLFMQMIIVYMVINNDSRSCGRHMSTNIDEKDEIGFPSSHNVVSMAKELDPTPNSGFSVQNLFMNKYFNKPEPTNPKPSSGSQILRTLNRPAKCKNLRLIIVVFSAPENIDARLAIRGTWGSATSPEVDTVFLLGSTSDASLQEKIVKEKDFYKDIVQEDFIDSNRNLTLKSIALLKWVNTFCKNAEFVLKVNDDNFVHVPNILNFLANKESKNKSIFGKMCRKIEEPSEEHGSEAYDNSEYICDKQQPLFVATSAFVISQDAIADLLDAAITMDRFPMEGTFITGVCAEYSNVPRIDEARFRMTADLDSPCSYRKLFATVLPPFSVFAAWWYTNNELFNLCENANETRALKNILKS